MAAKRCSDARRRKPGAIRRGPGEDQVMLSERRDRLVHIRSDVPMDKQIALTWRKKPSRSRCNHTFTQERRSTMRGTMLYGPRDVRFEERPDPTMIDPTDAIIRIAAACVCGSDLWPYRGLEPVTQPKPMGHEYCGMVEEVGSAVKHIKPGWFAADAANVKPGSTVVVVGDGAVGLLGVLSARQMGAERIIVMSRHESRQKLAREFGATDVVAERGDEGVARIMDMTNGIGADSALECVGTQEVMMQAIRSTRKGGYVSFVGVPHGVELNGEHLFCAYVH